MGDEHDQPRLTWLKSVKKRRRLLTVFASQKKSAAMAVEKNTAMMSGVNFMVLHR